MDFSTFGVLVEALPLPAALVSPEDEFMVNPPFENLWGEPLPPGMGPVRLLLNEIFSGSEGVSITVTVLKPGYRKFSAAWRGVRGDSGLRVVIFNDLTASQKRMTADRVFLSHHLYRLQCLVQAGPDRIDHKEIERELKSLSQFLTLDVGPLRLNRGTLPFDPFVAGVRDFFERRLAGEGISLDFAVTGGSKDRVSVDEERFYKLLDLLVTEIIEKFSGSKLLLELTPHLEEVEFLFSGSSLPPFPEELLFQDPPPPPSTWVLEGEEEAHRRYLAHALFFQILLAHGGRLYKPDGRWFGFRVRL